MAERATGAGDGRFAPTPSGPLHFGSLITAVASYCEAKSSNRRWMLRIEDLDTPRVVAGSADDILKTLDCFGLHWDGPVMHQSQRFDAYQAALDKLNQDGLVYACQCSRRSLQAGDPTHGPLGMIYPGSCRRKSLPFESHALRLNLQMAGTVRFHDLHCADQAMNLTDAVGDVVLKRSDGVYAYHLAVVIDDDLQGVDQIVRGADLLTVTPLHLHLYRLFGLPEPNYLHLPLARNAQGQKLSKQSGAPALDRSAPGQQLVGALQFLGQVIPSRLEREHPAAILEFAVANWQRKRIPAVDRTDTIST
jgi:glutamyl-Q tRNA(Asp) synthetase